MARYLHGPGRANEHVYAGRSGGAVIGGSLCLEGATVGDVWAHELREAAAARPEIAKAIWHVSLRAAPGDRALTDAEWADLATGFAARMGFEAHPWVLIRHGEDHVHLAMSRVNYDGALWAGRHDYRAAQAACSELEAEHRLAAAPRVSSAATKRVADHQLSAGEWRRAERTQTVPERVQLASRVHAALAASTGRGRDGFEAALEVAGVQHRASVASTGRVSGYSFHLPGHVDAAGEAVWLKASQVDKALSWGKVAPLLDPEQHPAPVPVVKVPKKLLQTRAGHQAQVRQAQQEAAEQAAERDRAQVPALAAAGIERAAGWWAARKEQAEQEQARKAAEAVELAEVMRIVRASQAYPASEATRRSPTTASTYDPARDPALDAQRRRDHGIER
ncbi:relaxase/mobilization nuclease domain-containing protein [Kineococcus auxinigenes]|uniref:relaxase/mobilization nuclease domain-containing protein n=1 Tax=unclassified Kineococcus TaxID=2621656 RepID=UPI003D7D6352